MGYVPKSLNADQQKSVLNVWDAHVKSRLTTDADMDDVSDLMTIRSILAEPPTERAPKSQPMARKRSARSLPAAAKVLPVGGEVK